MAKHIDKLTIDTTEAIEKIKSLNVEADKLKTAMTGVKQAAEDTEKAMRDFVTACSNINIDL